MNSKNDIKNIVRITADSKRFDSPKDDDTGAPIRFRQSDDLRVDVVFRINGKLADMSDIDYAELEIVDIGSINHPEPRDSIVLVRKRVGVSEMNLELSESSINAGDAHASFYLNKDDTSLKYGEKWLRVHIIYANGARASFANGWIYVEPSYGNESAEANPEDSKYIIKAREEALRAEGFSSGRQDNVAVDINSPYYQNNAEYFLQMASSHADNVESFAQRSESAALEAESFSANASMYATDASTSANLAQNASTEAQGYSEHAGELFSKASDFLLLKTNKSAFVLSGGTATASNMQSLPRDFSLMFRLKVDNWTSISNFARFIYTSMATALTNRGFAVYKSTNGLEFAYANGSLKQTLYVPSPDNKVHSYALTLANGHMKVFVDGELIEFCETTCVEISQTDEAFSLGSSGINAEISDIALVNFDMSADDSLYNASDYSSGKDIPLSLLDTKTLLFDAKQNWDSIILKSGFENLIDVSEVAKIVINDSTSITDTFATLRFTLPLTVDKNDIVMLKAEGVCVANSSNLFSISLGGINGTDGSGTIRKNIPQGRFCLNTQLDLLSEPQLQNGSNTLQILYLTTKTGIEASLSFDKLELYINGAIIALDNYTFKNGATRVIPDYSGKGNHAIVSGNLKGYADARIRAMCNQFSQETVLESE